MGSLSIGERVRGVELAVQGLFALGVQREVGREVQDRLGVMELAAQSARLFVREYEYAESRAEQQVAAKKARAELAAIQQLILFASQHDLLGPADVAQLSAEVQQITDELQ